MRNEALIYYRQEIEIIRASFTQVKLKIKDIIVSYWCRLPKTNGN
jgi:hypothetical protein